MVARRTGTEVDPRDTVVLTLTDCLSGLLFLDWDPALRFPGLDLLDLGCFVEASLERGSASLRELKSTYEANGVSFCEVKLNLRLVGEPARFEGDSDSWMVNEASSCSTITTSWRPLDSSSGGRKPCRYLRCPKTGHRESICG
ncbi:hypothetical protein AOL_s00169g263 [Orbilia oligospora ATCC 24927]|uniref:Uncharacterized protein n=1 Tax=Arthrobotrys oligospora (strain ATCC 24927 / CBS 115.81 / DSM 1491) TaxID=756982 RepID=G1XN60_ARTOA|nr:hypothetical protein AOL_s00169g263 [Orbilia oligospora ATCC 24927]EGX45657.1 hypothetical protein AOL_s00169g263 [Orbilia oligospora ATCC 24927]